MQHLFFPYLLAFSAGRSLQSSDTGRVCLPSQPLGCWHREPASNPAGTRKHQEGPCVPEGHSSNTGPLYMLKNPKLSNLSE